MLVTPDRLSGVTIFLNQKERDCLLGHLEDDLELSPDEYKSNDRYKVVEQLVGEMRAASHGN